MNAITRKFFLFLSALSLFKFFFEKLTTLTLFDYSDELLLLFSLLLITYDVLSKRKMSLIHIAIFGFLGYSILISVLFGLNRNLFHIVVQSLVSIKFFIILASFVILFKNHIEEIKKFFFYAMVFAGIGIFLHILLGETFNTIYGVSKYTRPGFSTIRYTGFFRHPNHMAYMVVVFIALILNDFKNKKQNIDTTGWLKIVIGLFIIVLADTRTAILAVGILLTFFYWGYIYKNFLVFFGFLFLGILTVTAVLIFTDLPESIMDNIEASYSLESDYIRGLMFYMSLLLIVKYFPIGSGAGSFGSIYAKDSQVYKDFGVDKRFYFVEEWGIYDSNFASIIGEYGFIGIIVFIILFKFSYLHLKSNFSGLKVSPMLKATLWVFVFFCISNPMLTNNVYILLSVPVLMLIANTEKA